MNHLPIYRNKSSLGNSCLHGPLCLCTLKKGHRVTHGATNHEEVGETAMAKTLRVFRDALEEIEDVLSNIPEHLQSALTRELQIRARNALIIADTSLQCAR